MFGIDLETQPEIVQTVARYLIQGWDLAASWLLSLAAWSQFGLLVVAYFAAVLVSRRLSPVLEKLLNPSGSTNIFGSPRRFVMQFLPLLLPLQAYVFTGIGEGIVRSLFDSGAVIALGKRVFLFLAVRVLVRDIITDSFLKVIGKFIFLPIAALYTLELLDVAQAQLTATEVAVGNIKFSVMVLICGLIVGSLLFWLGGWSNQQSSTFIAKLEEMRPSIRQLLSKTVEFMIFGLAFLLLMNIMGVILSALAVLGGAIGVGLQKITSNFNSGVILFVEGQVTVGDYVELDGGEAGTIVKMTTRAAILETFDGRWIVVPNEDFITTRVVNYSDSGSASRNDVPFWSAMILILILFGQSLRRLLQRHPDVLDKPYPPDCELMGFGGSGIDFALEFWVNGIEGGHKNTNPKCCLSFGMH